MLVDEASVLSEPMLEPTIVCREKPVYAVSDLHLGGGGPRDNFAHMSDGRRKIDFGTFLDYVEARAAQLVIIGDFFELWQSNMSKVIVRHRKLLDRLAAMGATYVLGNHDADLRYFMFPQAKKHGDWLNHPFFRRMADHYNVTLGDQKIRFIHGHQADSYCDSDTPGFGRISAIYSGIWEDRHGSPLITKYCKKSRTVESATVGRIEQLITFFRRLLGKPGRFEEINRNLIELYGHSLCDVLVTGHTHRAGKIRDQQIYNTGTWAEKTCSFVSVDCNGRIGVWDWVNGVPRCNNTILEI